MNTYQAAIDFEDFNTSTRRGPGPRKHDLVTVRRDVSGGVYVTGAMGCSKTFPEVRDAIKAYLGGRELLAYREFA